MITNTIIKKMRPVLSLLNNITDEEYESVLQFHREYMDFRTPEACSRETGIPLEKCLIVKQRLYKKRLLGNYFFEKNAPPQKFMYREILNQIPSLNVTSKILEVGPGNNPIVSPLVYPSWFGVDKYYINGQIQFKDQAWAKDKYPQERMFCGSYEELSLVIPEPLHGTFDLVCGSHSYEHVLRPIQALKECHRMLRQGGVLILFVPDGFSDDPSSRLEMTHSLYLVPSMIEEFFEYAGGYTELKISPFRPNADLMIIAEKT